jgi:predicted ribosome quality control (RQC) complex YloA/Tae2 family protein
MGGVKVRFDGLDVTAMVAYLQRRLLGRRIVNIYDGDSGESYIFKLEGDQSKEFLLIESSQPTSRACLSGRQ